MRPDVIREAIATLIAQRDAVDRAIAMFEEMAQLGVGRARPRPGRKFMPPEERKAASERMRERWRLAKAADNVTP
jgi:hypothetical protein